MTDDEIRQAALDAAKTWRKREQVLIDMGSASSEYLGFCEEIRVLILAIAARFADYPEDNDA